MKIMLNNNNMDNNMDYKGGFRGAPKVPGPPFSLGIFPPVNVYRMVVEHCLNVYSLINIVNKKSICVRSLHF